MRLTAMTALATVAVLLSGGAASGSEVFWTPAHELAPVGLTGAIAAGDLDGDGDDDIGDFSYGSVYWSTGCPGPPLWQPESGVFPNLAGCTENSGTLGDCDADGDLDLVYGCNECCSLRMLWNVGTAQELLWQSGGAIAGDPYGGYYAYVQLCDIDADGDLDLVGTNGTGDVKAWRNTGTAGIPCWEYLGPVPGIDFPVSDGRVALADLDGDADQDIVGGSSFSRVKCWENTGTPAVWSYTRNDSMLNGVTTAAIGVHGVALPDVDCDGDADLVIVSWNGAVYLYLNERITPVTPHTWGTIKAFYR